MAPKKKVKQQFFFSPLSFIAVFESEIRDPGWVKIRNRDKHPGSATLLQCMLLSSSCILNVDVMIIHKLLVRASKCLLYQGYGSGAAKK
jgi:hypothetical protein